MRPRTAVRDPTGQRSLAPGLLLATPTALCVGGFMCLVALAAALSGMSVASMSTYAPVDATTGMSEFARRDIPAEYRALYRAAAVRYGLDWAILAGIGKVECDHGRDHDPSCTRQGAVNSAGAGGPMQFIGETWARYGIDGNGDGNADRWDPADAVFSAASYLRASGAPHNYSAAILAYNHSPVYLAAVEGWARRYRGTDVPMPAEPGTTIGSGSIGYVGGERAVLEVGNGHVALVPTAAPAVVQAMIIAGNELQELPYGPGGHPDPRGAPEEDCSSTINYLLYRAGVRPISEILRDNPLAQDYVTWGLPGPGHWVTIYATDAPTAHVFAVVAGLRIDTSHTGTDVGPNRAEDGPRWRILDHIPTWAHWSVRHPAGL